MEDDGDIAVVSEATHGREALSELDRFRPDVLPPDQRMPAVDGLGVLRESARRRADTSRHRHVDTRVVVLTTFGEDVDAFVALRPGAVGLPIKDTGSAGGR
ncbi:response regulator [Nocardiopsis sp. MG754419]|uniref:response regulator n=1 Tax=Nocardiopsis sp. MG754419 TaxID=2259865 RepID=UPI002010ECFD|nr:response regulator [Nocardiopsis sp. MG754419]